MFKETNSPLKNRVEIEGLLQKPGVVNIKFWQIYGQSKS